MAGLRLGGVAAPFVLDGPINRTAFEVSLERVLVPELRPGDVVVMDNLSSHKGPRVREMIEAAGARLLDLPPYSPDFNPIENAFANSPLTSPTGCACRCLKPAPLKALLRKAAERTVEGLRRAIGRLINEIKPPNASTCSPQQGTMQHDWKPL